MRIPVALSDMTLKGQVQCHAYFQAVISDKKEDVRITKGKSYVVSLFALLDFCHE